MHHSRLIHLRPRGRSHIPRPQEPRPGIEGDAVISDHSYADNHSRFQLFTMRSAWVGNHVINQLAK